MPSSQVFINRTKAFYIDNHEAFSVILGKAECPPTFFGMIKQLHRHIEVRLTFNGQLSDELSADNGMKQGNILAPSLFSIFFATLLSHAFHNSNKGNILR